MTTTPVHQTSGWFRAFAPGDRAEIRLVCLPHAGGAPTAFSGWQRLLPTRVQVLAACYPGRQDRLLEPCLPDMEPMAEGLTTALAAYLDRPMAIFGHSMGSAIAYEVALRLAQRYGAHPVRLFVSGRGAPHRVPHTDVHAHDDAALLAHIRTLGGTDAAVFEHPELRELLLPSLRSDYRLIERYRPAPADVRPVGVPITGYLGDADPACTPVQFNAWSELTTAGFQPHIFTGGHFFLAAHENELVSNIVSYL